MTQRLTKRQQKRIDRLKAQCNILQTQIDSGSLRDFSEHKAQLDALLWAVRVLSKIPADTLSLLEKT